MRVATWNVNSLKARLPRVEAWLAECEPDILCLQETKLADSAFPSLTFSALGYESVHHGEGRWNGVAILSKVGLESASVGFGPEDEIMGDEARIVSATCGGIRIASVYVPNGRSLDDEQYQFKLEWLDRLRSHLESVCDANANVMVCGDFNIAPEDRDVYAPDLWREQVLCTTAERAAFRDWLALGFKDAFRLFDQPERAFSWWDYRMLAFPKNNGLRIDHILLSPKLASECTGCSIDRAARKGDRPSDHAPVLAEIAA